MPKFYYRDPVDGQFKPFIMPSQTFVDEIVVSATEPTDPAVELWVDTATEPMDIMDPLYLPVTGAWMSGNIDFPADVGVRWGNGAALTVSSAHGNEVTVTKGGVLAPLGVAAPATDSQAARPESLVIMEGTLTWGSSWADKGTTYQSGKVYKQGSLAWIESLAQPTVNISIAVGTSYLVGTIPTGFRPTQRQIFTAVSTQGDINSEGRWDLLPDGSIMYTGTRAGTMAPTGQWVTVTGCWRVAV